MSGRILIVNDGKDAGYPYAPFFSKLGFEITEDKASLFLNPEKFKLVVFTGGADVTPEIYGDTSPYDVCYTNPKRDAEESKIFHWVTKRQIGMFGICRGLQFINVMAGGKLIHDLRNHNGMHSATTSDKESFPVNSLHHQACIPPMDAEVLAWSTEKRSPAYIGDGDEEFDYKGPEVEAVHYPIVKAAGVQWHPECFVNEKEPMRAMTWAYLLARDVINCTPEGFRKLYYIGRPKVSYVKTN